MDRTLLAAGNDQGQDVMCAIFSNGIDVTLEVSVRVGKSNNWLRTSYQISNSKSAGGLAFLITENPVFKELMQ